MIKPNWYPDDRNLRQFSAAALVGFPLIGLAFHRWFGWTTGSWIIAAIGPVICVAGLIRPGVVYPLYTLLMTVTMPIGWVVSNVLLRVIFYVFLTPIGWVFRLIGRDPLVLKRPQAASYWVRHAQRTDPVSYYRQA